jgi:hypothetical protein
MLKLKKDAIKTMAAALNKGGQPSGKTQEAKSLNVSEGIVDLNKILRKGFGIPAETFEVGDRLKSQESAAPPQPSSRTAKKIDDYLDKKKEMEDGCEIGRAHV